MSYQLFLATMKKKKSKLYEWQTEAPNNICFKCGEARFITVDHIIPVHWMLELGLKEFVYEMEDNFQFLCKWCNQEKRGGIDTRNPKTFEVLEKIINIAKNEVIQKNEFKENTI